MTRIKENEKIRQCHISIVLYNSLLIKNTLNIDLIN